MGYMGYTIGDMRLYMYVMQDFFSSLLSIDHVSGGIDHNEQYLSPAAFAKQGS